MLSALAAQTVQALQEKPVMHRWLPKLLTAYRPAAQYRSLVEGWPPPFQAQASRPRGRRTRPPAGFSRFLSALQEVRP
jgi:hypothetical protein